MKYKWGNPDFYIENISQDLDERFKNFEKYFSDVDYTKIGYCDFVIQE